jgi:hypothetical protein
MDSHFQTLIKKEFVRSLDHNPGPVTCIAFAAARTTVFHIFQNCQSIRNYRVATVSANIRYKADTTGITFKFRRI